MTLEQNKCYMLAKRNHGEETIFLLGVDFFRTVNGRNRWCLSYSEVYGCTETVVDFEDVDYMYPIIIDKNISNRLIEKWGEDISKERGIIKEKDDDKHILR